jgi:tRNA(Ile)-lysidine synthase
VRDRDDAARFGFDAQAFAALPEEIRLRLLKRAIDRAGHEGPAELGKVEALLAVLDNAIANGQKQSRLKQTLAGAAISLTGGRIYVDAAPPRASRA